MILIELVGKIVLSLMLMAGLFFSGCVVAGAAEDLFKYAHKKNYKNVVIDALLIIAQLYCAISAVVGIVWVMTR